MNVKKMNKLVVSIISFAMILPSITPLAVKADTSEVKLPEPRAVYDFSYDFEELADQYEGFEVVDNAAAPELIEDEEMGQVLKLNKAVIEDGDQQFAIVNGEESGYIISDNSEYSTINIENPYKGLGIDLYEYEPYEDVELTTYRNCEQPLWKNGITISYWIKTPAGEDGLGLNSNVVGFTGNRYQMQSDDYAKYLCTVKYDLDAQKYTDEEKALLGITLQQVDIYSDFYFELATDELYLDEPIYRQPSDDPKDIDDRMGKTYWMNPNFTGTNGYLKMDDGSVDKTYASDRYDWWNVAPILNDETQEHDPNGSRIRYAWTYSEMWLDASSSFYFENDADNVNEQLNPNSAASYGTKVGMQLNNSFNINSWKGSCSSIEEANAAGTLAESPITLPDEWHNVTCVIQNDWVTYYLDGDEIEMEDYYSSFGWEGYAKTIGNYKPWKRFNKGTGSRYGYGNNKKQTYWCWYGNYVSTTMMEWIVKDCVNAKIGGGNVAGDGYLMYANTDEIMLKNVVFYDEILDEDQIELLYEDPFIYDKNEPDIEKYPCGDVNADGKINANDALEVLKHAVGLSELDGEAYFNGDLTMDNVLNAVDALIILRHAAKISVISFNSKTDVPSIGEQKATIDYKKNSDGTYSAELILDNCDVSAYEFVLYYGDSIEIDSYKHSSDLLNAYYGASSSNNKLDENAVIFTGATINQSGEKNIISGSLATVNFNVTGNTPELTLVNGLTGEVIDTVVIETEIPEYAPVIEVQDTVARAGNTIQVPVLIKNNPGITAVTVNVEYNSDIMTLKSATNNNLLNGAMYTASSSTNENPYTMIWVVGTSDIKSNGTLATLEFEIKEGAEAGEYPISISYNEDDIYNTNFENVHFYTADGMVTVKDIMPGDVNGDGKINTKDAALLLQYFVAIVNSIDEEVADVNNDGKVNSKDASMILQYCAGWDVVLQ